MEIRVKFNDSNFPRLRVRKNNAMLILNKDYKSAEYGEYLHNIKTASKHFYSLLKKLKKYNNNASYLFYLYSDLENNLYLKPITKISDMVKPYSGLFYYNCYYRGN